MQLLHLILYIKVLVFVIKIVNAQYEPEVLVEALSPRGLRVSIEDEEGVSLFSFHGNINKELHGREGGTLSIDIWKPKNGRWTYLTKGPKLKIGDVIYYWVNVDFDDGNGKRGYVKDNQVFVVKELISNVSTTSTVTERSTSVSVITKIQCQKSVTIVQGDQKCQGELIFNEEFDSFDENRWRSEIRFAGSPDYEFVIYQNSKDNLHVEKGQLYIKPTIVEDKFGKDYVIPPRSLDLGESCTGVPGTVDCFQAPQAWQVLPPVFSAQISTINHFSFTYGVVEITARFPKGDWIYPELYLKPKNEDYGQRIDSGIMRIAYSPGNEELSHRLQGGCVLGESVAARNYAMKTIRSQKRWNNATYVFRLEWKADSITLKVDNQVYGNIYPPNEGFAVEEQQLELKEDVAKSWRSGSRLAPFDKEMYVVLGVGVGGLIFPNQGNGRKPWDNFNPKAQLNFYQATSTWRKTWTEDSMLIVDSVKVWAL